MFFVQKSFFQYFLCFQSQSCLLKSTAAIFRQSSGYVFSIQKCQQLNFKWRQFITKWRQFSLFDYFSFSIFNDFFVFWLAFFQLICWSVRVLLRFSFISLNCVSGLVLLCFLTSSNKKMFRFTSFCRFFNILRDIFLTSLG